MIFKTTNKDIRAGYTYLIKVPYCAAADLLRGRNRIAYTAGVYGWNADVYDLSDIYPDTAICTGYRPTGHAVPFELIDEYNAAARRAGESYKFDFVNADALRHALLTDFISRAVDYIDRAVGGDVAF